MLKTRTEFRFGLVNVDDRHASTVLRRGLMFLVLGIVGLLWFVSGREEVETNEKAEPFFTDSEASSTSRYAVIVDAQSPNASLHVHKFTPEGQYLSTFRPTGTDSLDSLFRIASTVVPSSQIPCTPILVRVSDAREVEETEALAAALPFDVPDDGVDVMQEGEEAALSWFATGYIMGELGIVLLTLNEDDTQIVLAPGPVLDSEEFRNYKHELWVADERYLLYQRTFARNGLRSLSQRVSQDQTFDDSTTTVDTVLAETFHNVAFPPIYAATPVVLTGYFVDVLEPLLRRVLDTAEDGLLITTVDRLSALIRAECAEADPQLHECLNLMIVYRLLRTGYRLEPSQEVTIVAPSPELQQRVPSISNPDWTLGAALKLVLDRHQRC